MEGYQKRFEKITETIESEEIREIARNGSNHFSRNRKMPLEDLVICTMAKHGLTTIMELYNYWEKKGSNAMQISKQGYLQQRKKLNYEVFAYLNEEYLKDFYTSGEAKLWNGYVVLAIDGSKAEVPNSNENYEKFGQSSNQHGVSNARALVSGAMDVFNQFILDIEIGCIEKSESELAKENIRRVKDMLGKLPILILFDRGYPSIEFMHYLNTIGVKYLFRLSCNDYIKERAEMRTGDETVPLLHTKPRINKMKIKHPKEAEILNQQPYTEVRLIQETLPSGTEIALMTNLQPQIDTCQIKELYTKRWEIEKGYHTLKNKMKFENVAGKASIYVYQDFWAQIVIYNMIQDVVNAANGHLIQRQSDKPSKYPLRMNIAIGLFKKSLINLFLIEDPSERVKNFRHLQNEIERYVLPKRTQDSHPRKRNVTNKYKNNQKNSF